MKIPLAIFYDSNFQSYGTDWGFYSSNYAVVIVSSSFKILQQYCSWKWLILRIFVVVVERVINFTHTKSASACDVFRDVIRLVEVIQRERLNQRIFEDYNRSGWDMNFSSFHLEFCRIHNFFKNYSLVIWRNLKWK